MSRLRGLLMAMTLLAATPAAAQSLVTSAAPDRVGVTVYRDPGRTPDRSLNLAWLNGFALITETRQITIPAGESEIRFEGVAGGIVPQSAIVTGLPDIVERNRDALLLSPGTLLDRSLGRRVHLRRTSLATGEVREHEAVIRSGANGAVVLQTADGFEALRCTGLAETPLYDRVPPDLSARPTLSVRVRSPEPVTATVTLSYLATGFDWQANYVATLAPDHDRVELFAWLTLANGDETGFVDADAQAVAGRLNYQRVRPPPSEARPLNLRCWPAGTTSDIEEEDFDRGFAGMPPPPPPPPPMAPPPAAVEMVTVTGSRVAMQAEQEELGDLKLYRIPEPVTVAANSQKQVALLQRSGVHVELVYRARLDATAVGGPLPATRYLVSRNRSEDGLGLPLPAGGLALFAVADGRPLLVGQGQIGDTAVGEDVEVAIGGATGVATEIELVDRGDRPEEHRLTVTNDRAEPIRFEVEFDVYASQDFRPRRSLDRRDGRPLWTVTVPANGTATLRYRVREID